MMDPADLPELVVERLFSFLQVEGLLKSSLVNSMWRDAVNKNVIWKRHCTLPISFENVPCKVLPIFQTPPNDCELSPLCRYRIHYMRQVHVQNNFIDNRCVYYSLSKTYDKFTFLGKYLIVNNPSEKVFEVWDIELSPDQIQPGIIEVPHTPMPGQAQADLVRVPYLLKNMDLKTFQIVGDMLLIVQCNLLQMYHIDDGIVSLDLCRIFDKEEKLSEMIPSDDSVSSWYASTIDVVPKVITSHNEVVGNYFIGIVESPNLNESTLHIWDLKSGNKLKEDQLPPLEIKISKIICGTNSQFLYIALYMSAAMYMHSCCKIVCYSLKTLQYTQFCMNSEQYIDSMLIGEKVIVLTYCQANSQHIWTIKGIMCLDAVTGLKIWEKTCHPFFSENRLDLNNNLLVYVNRYTEVTVVNVSSGEEVSSFNVDTFPARFYLLDNNMLLVGRYNECPHPIVEVWDIFKKQVVNWFHKQYIVPCGRSLARLSGTHRNSGRTLVSQYW